MAEGGWALHGLGSLLRVAAMGVLAASTCSGAPTPRAQEQPLLPSPPLALEHWPDLADSSPLCLHIKAEEVPTGHLE